MGTCKLDIIWSPCLNNRFITVGTDVQLYSYETVDPAEENPGTYLNIQGKIKLLCVNSEIQYIKCACWYPNENYDGLIAVGQPNGKVVLISFNEDVNASHGVGREFAPKYARQCNSLSWNPEESNLLAVGLDKHRMEASLLIWDVFRSSGYGDQDRRPLVNLFDNTSSLPRCLSEAGDVVHSLEWLRHQPKSLIAGVNQKYLRIYDLRDATQPQSSTPTKGVHGVCVDPFNMHRVSSYFENQLMIWDIRNFEKPLVSLSDSRPFSKISWCPTRKNLLGTLTKDGLVLKLCDFRQTCIGTDDLEPSIVERNVQACSQSPLSSFCWHPSQENLIITINNTNEINSEFVPERITVNWSPCSTLVWSQDKKMLYYIDQTDPVYDTFEDVSVKMHKRALSGYGLENQLISRNGEFVKEDDSLCNLWKWFGLAKRLVDDGKLQLSLRECPGVGVHAIIRGYDNCNGGTYSNSELLHQNWGVVNAVANHYKSTDREKALQLCGWEYEKDGAISDKFLDRLAFEGHYERAAAIAIFNLKMRKAVDVLKKGGANNPSSNIYTVAMALSGYSTDADSLWKEMCDKFRNHLVQPYLRVMFAFLTCNNDNYEEVLQENSLLLQDRVAFACLYLPDNKLAEFLDITMQHLVQTGCLDGMLLTGFNKSGIDLLQRYIDKTCDIQTVCSVLIHAVPSNVECDPRITQWIESYRDLLDQWRLWHHRAKFDVTWHKGDPAYRTSQQVFISCNFCGKSISSLMHTMGRGRQYTKLGGTTHKSKFTCCPGCRKPLPRCALCLVNMGTPSGSFTSKIQDKPGDASEQKLSAFCEWFTWCQSCCHGGHANHIVAWFKDHTECPVSACTCKCMALDSLTQVET